MKEKNHNGKDVEKHAGADHAHADPDLAVENKPHSHQHVHGRGSTEHKQEPDKAAQADAEKMKVAAAEVAVLTDRLLRLQADFDNMRKRTLRDKNEVYRRANEDMMLELLPVLDHLDLALASAKSDESTKTHGAVIDGFKLVSEQFVSVLTKFGAEPIGAEGQPFDVNRHEAVSQIASETIPEGTVIAQTRRGWMLGDKLLRPAQVVISAGQDRKVKSASGEDSLPEDGDAESGNPKNE